MKTRLSPTRQEVVYTHYLHTIKRHLSVLSQVRWLRITLTAPFLGSPREAAVLTVVGTSSGGRVEQQVLQEARDPVKVSLIPRVGFSFYLRSLHPGAHKIKITYYLTTHIFKRGSAVIACVVVRLSMSCIQDIIIT